MVVRTSARGRRVAKHACPRPNTIQVTGEVASSIPPAGKHHYDCHVCAGAGTLTVERRADGRGYWVNCWRDCCQALGGAYLRELAACVGAPGGGAVLSEPLRWLGEPSARTTTNDPAELPSTANLAGWQSRLFSDAALLYLTDERGLTEETIRAFGIGYDCDDKAFTFPVYDADGELVQLVRRYWPKVPRDRRSGKRIPYKVLKGRQAALYPQPLPTRGWLLVAGTLDAIIGRQYGLPTVTSTNGTSFPERWYPLVRRRVVYVAYDVGEEKTMQGRVASLREAGADAYAVRLARVLENGKDLSDYLTSEGTRDELLHLIKRERTASRRRKGAP
jgi:hypothetical protein